MLLSFPKILTHCANINTCVYSICLIIARSFSIHCKEKKYKGSFTLLHVQSAKYCACTFFFSFSCAHGQFIQKYWETSMRWIYLSLDQTLTFSRPEFIPFNIVPLNQVHQMPNNIYGVLFTWTLCSKNAVNNCVILWI